MSVSPGQAHWSPGGALPRGPVGPTPPRRRRRWTRRRDPISEREGRADHWLPPNIAFHYTYVHLRTAPALVIAGRSVVTSLAGDRTAVATRSSAVRRVKHMEGHLHALLGFIARIWSFRWHPCSSSGATRCSSRWKTTAGTRCSARPPTSRPRFVRQGRSVPRPGLPGRPPPGSASTSPQAGVAG